MNLNEMMKNGSSFRTQIDLFLDWYANKSVDFACIYFDQPDSVAHGYGPDSDEYMNEINRMDFVLAHLFNKLAKYGLLDQLNIIIVSDHCIYIYIYTSLNFICIYLASKKKINLCA